jgi:hypothetical protein
MDSGIISSHFAKTRFTLLEKLSEKPMEGLTPIGRVSKIGLSILHHKTDSIFYGIDFNSQVRSVTLLEMDWRSDRHHRLSRNPSRTNSVTAIDWIHASFLRNPRRVYHFHRSVRPPKHQ